MSITGALMGFSVASIIVGIIGSIVAGVSWIEADKWDDNTKRKRYIVFFVGASIVGGLG